MKNGYVIVENGSPYNFSDNPRVYDSYSEALNKLSLYEHSLFLAHYKTTAIVNGSFIWFDKNDPKVSNTVTIEPAVDYGF